MRIVIVCHTAGLAGAEIAISESIQALKQAGHSVWIIVPEMGPFIELVNPWIEGYQIVRQDHWTGVGELTLLQKIKFLRGFYRSAKAIRSYLKEVGADVVITNTSTVPAGALGAAWAGVPHIWYVHEFVREDHGLTWQYGERFSYWLMDRLSRAIVVNSLAVRRKLEHFMYVPKIHLVYCATEIDWQPIPFDTLPGEPVILMAGAVSAGKNQALAVQALAEPELFKLGARLRIVGAAPDREKTHLLEMAEKLGVRDSIEFMPFMTDRRKVFSLGNVLVVASVAEAFGRVVVEAQKSGLPVAMADAGAAREVIEDGESGLLFKAQDAGDLARKAARLMTDESLRNSIREKGVADADRRFSLQTHYAQLSQAIEAAVRSS